MQDIVGSGRGGRPHPEEEFVAVGLGSLHKTGVPSGIRTTGPIMIDGEIPLPRRAGGLKVADRVLAPVWGPGGGVPGPPLGVVDLGHGRRERIGPAREADRHAARAPDVVRRHPASAVPRPCSGHIEDKVHAGGGTARCAASMPSSASSVWTMASSKGWPQQLDQRGQITADDQRDQQEGHRRPRRRAARPPVSTQRVKTSGPSRLRVGSRPCGDNDAGQRSPARYLRRRRFPHPGRPPPDRRHLRRARARQTRLEPQLLGGEVWTRYVEGEYRPPPAMSARTCSLQIKAGPEDAAAFHDDCFGRGRRSAHHRRSPSPRSARFWAKPGAARRPPRRPTGSSRTWSPTPPPLRRPRPARPGPSPPNDFTALYPACVAMYTEEAGHLRPSSAAALRNSTRPGPAS